MLSAHVPRVNMVMNDLPRMQSALLQHTSGQSCCIQASHRAQAMGMLVSEACMQIQGTGNRKELRFPGVRGAQLLEQQPR